MVYPQLRIYFQFFEVDERACTDKTRLPRWRHNLREQLLPILRWETPYLAWFQANLRSPALDSYFAISANLGTHTFFMIMLPILFWCGYTNLGRGYVLLRQLGRGGRLCNNIFRSTLSSYFSHLLMPLQTHPHPSGWGIF